MTTNLTVLLAPGEAILGITWNGEYGELPDPISFDSTEQAIRRFATEAIAHGGVPGISVDPNVDFSLFQIDRFEAKTDRSATIQLRPKVPFGAQACYARP